MDPIRVIISNVFPDPAAQMNLTEDNQVIEKLPATTSDPPLRRSIGPSRQQHPMRTLKIESSKSHTLFILSSDARSNW